VGVWVCPQSASIISAPKLFVDCQNNTNQAQDGV
jgi:hypothetical protein